MIGRLAPPWDKLLLDARTAEDLRAALELMSYRRLHHQMPQCLWLTGQLQHC